MKRGKKVGLRWSGDVFLNWSVKNFLPRARPSATLGEMKGKVSVVHSESRGRPSDSHLLYPTAI